MNPSASSRVSNTIITDNTGGDSPPNEIKNIIASLSRGDEITIPTIFDFEPWGWYLCVCAISSIVMIPVVEIFRLIRKKDNSPPPTASPRWAARQNSTPIPTPMIKKYIRFVEILTELADRLSRPGFQHLKVLYGS